MSPDPEVKMHAWRIDPRQYARHEQRRGKRHAFERVDPARTALIVVDMIPFFVNENPYCRGIIANIRTLAHSLRSAGGTIAWILPARRAQTSEGAKEFFGPDIAQMFNNSAGTGPLRERLWSGFELHENDLVLEKSAASAFFPGRSVLPERLAERSINTVLITGTVTNVCCESSARDASTLGYRVIMVADANASVDDESHNATLHTIYRTFGDVRPTTEVLGLINESTST